MSVDLEGIHALAPEAALERLVPAWRATSDAGLGKAIEAVGRRTIREIDGLAKAPKARAAELVRMLGRAKPATLSSVLAEVEIFVRNSSAGVSYPVVDALHDRTADPRIAYLANRLFEKPPSSTSDKLERRLLDCIEKHGDAGVLEKLDSISFDAARLEEVRGKLARRGKGTPVDEAIVRALCAEAPGPRRAADLLAAVVAAPDDDGPRRVLADAWLEEGDRRGEWIALQLAGNPRAEKAFLAKHRVELMGPFAQCAKVASVGFRRGFLTRATASGGWPAVPENTFLEELDLDGWTFDPACRFDRLVKARTRQPAQFAMLMDAAPRLVDLEMAFGDASAVVALPERRMDRVRFTAGRDRQFVHAVLRAPICQRARSIELYVHASGDHRLADLLAELPPSCERFVLEHRDMMFELTREDGAWCAVVTVEASDPHREILVRHVESALRDLVLTRRSFAIRKGPDPDLAAQLARLR